MFHGVSREIGSVSVVSNCYGSTNPLCTTEFHVFFRRPFTPRLDTLVTVDDCIASLYQYLKTASRDLIFPNAGSTLEKSWVWSERANLVY